MNSIYFNGSTCRPSKVVCIGRNYAEHIKELDNEMPEEMVFFIKPNSSISGELHFSKSQNSCHYEAELSFLVMGGKIRAVGFGLDLTLREVQTKLKNKGLPWERAKAFDGSAVFSEFVSFNDITKLHLSLHVNGELKQEGGYALMINKPEQILAEAKTFLSFEDGDVLMSGTPKGVGEFKVGDVFTCRVFEGEKLLIEKKLHVGSKNSI